MQKECMKCGHCCRCSIIDEVYDVDIEREPRLKPHVTELKDEPGRYFLKTPCPFLGQDNTCTIYPTRPTICVVYEPGSTPVCSQFEGVICIFDEKA